MDKFYIDTNDFIPWGIEHYSILSILLVYAIYFLYMGRSKWDLEAKKKNVLYLCLVMIFFQLLKPSIRWYLGNFSAANDLPLHLCPLMPFALMLVFYFESRRYWAIFFFWIVAGSSQALFTTIVKDVLPHYESIRYWTIHGGITIAALYGFFAYNWRLKPSDVLYSALAMNVAALVIYPINLVLNSNYFYLNAKPPGTNLYTFLPPWPWYLLCLEGILFLLFSFVFIIFTIVSYFLDNKIKAKNYVTRN